MSARNVFWVCYDIAEDKRRDRVYRLMRGWGDRLLYSIWRVLLGRKDRVELEASLAPLLHAREDQVILVDLGPSQGRALQCLHTLGRPQAAPPADKPHIF
jgi:CRISPR-associated protein Cas2